MAIKLEAAQLLLYRAGDQCRPRLAVGLRDRGRQGRLQLRPASRSRNEAVQIMGATGYSRETLVEYCMRRCRGWMIAGGSVEMLKNRIAEHVFDRRFDQRPPRKAEAAE